MKVDLEILHPNAIVPKYQTIGAAGFDLHSLEDVVLKPKETKLIKTGLAFAVPVGYALDIRPRSGMSLKTKFRVANSPGTIDSDYRGEVCIIAENIDLELDGIGSRDIKIKSGDRVAQGVFVRIEQGQFEVKDKLSKTKRGTGGYGSTGKN